MSLSQMVIKKDSQFRRVYSEGRREAGERVVIYYLRTDEGGVLPGFVASRRIGKANKRNRAKRLMREAFKRLENRISERNLWIVFIASFHPAETHFDELFKDVESSMARAGLISTSG